MHISVVIPVYNEEENIPELARRIKRCLGRYSYEVVFVDDGSRDKSFFILRELAKTDARIKVLCFRKNFGQTAAIAAGFDHAAGDVVVPLDADLQEDPKDIPKLLAKLEEGYDVVSGWRRRRQDPYFSKVLPSRMANAFISFITGVHLHDYGCTLKAYRKAAIKGLKLYGEMHRFLPAYVSWNGYRVTEMEVTHSPRIHGLSKYGIGKTFRVMLDLLVVRFFTKYATRPMHFFGFAGIWSFLASGAALSLALYWKFAGEKTLIQTPLPLFSALFFLIGIVFILMGLLAELLMRTYYESQGERTYVIREKIHFS